MADGGDRALDLPSAGDGAVAPSPHRPYESQPHGLDGAAIAERLTLRSPQVVEELGRIVQRIADDEDKRKMAVETKASGLLAVVAVAVTLITSVGGALASNKDLVQNLGEGKIVVALLVTMSVFLGLSVAAAALSVLKVSVYHTPTGDGIFNKDVLQDADKLLDSDDDPLAPVTYFRRYFIRHQWEVYLRNVDANDLKVVRLAYAQRLLFAFLLSAALLALTLVVTPLISSPTDRAERDLSNVQQQQQQQFRHLEATASTAAATSTTASATRRRQEEPAHEHE